VYRYNIVLSILHHSYIWDGFINKDCLLCIVHVCVCVPLMFVLHSLSICTAVQLFMYDLWTLQCIDH